MLNFKKPDKDILQASPRSIQLIDGSGLFCKALNIYKLSIYVDYLLQEANESGWVQKAVEIGADINKLKDLFLDSFEIDYVSSEKGYWTKFKPFDFVSNYFTVQDEQVRIISQASCLEAWLTIIEQNNLLQILKRYTGSKDESYFKAYTHSFNIMQIMQLNLVDGLSLTNWDDLLTWEQLDFYSDLVEQKSKRDMQNTYIAVQTVVANRFGAKIDFIKDVLFKGNASEVDLKEHTRKGLLGSKYTGNKEEDDKLIVERLKKLNIKDFRAFL